QWFCGGADTVSLYSLYPTIMSSTYIDLPPPSPLFPSTTLFRSLSVDDARAYLATSVLPRLAMLKLIVLPMGALWGDVPVAFAPEDRKSTRLNSSHVSISYAVFCLKKKRQASRTRLCRPRVNRAL